MKLIRVRGFKTNTTINTKQEVWKKTRLIKMTTQNLDHIGPNIGTDILRRDTSLSNKITPTGTRLLKKL